jgi:hypothetical protein
MLLKLCHTGLKTPILVFVKLRFTPILAVPLELVKVAVGPTHDHLECAVKATQLHGTRDLNHTPIQWSDFGQRDLQTVDWRRCLLGGHKDIVPVPTRTRFSVRSPRTDIALCYQYSHASDEDLKAEIERLRAENEALKKPSRGQMSLKVSEKGGLSVYGLGRFPVTLYKEQWVRLLAMADEIRTFIRENDSALKRKE